MGNPYPATFIDQNNEGRLVGEVDFTDAANRPGGSSAVVSCLLVRTTGLSIHASAVVPIVWDGLVDNTWDFTPLAAIPAGLGLSFAFGGSSADLTTTAAGTWAFACALSRASDATWVGDYDLGAARQMAWPASALLVTDVLTLPSGAILTPVVDVATQSTANPYTCTAQLSIVRLA